jgi:hypothetical protein
MENTEKQIHAEIIDGKLILNGEVLCIEKLHKLFNMWGPDDIIEEINTLVFSLAQIGLLATEDKIDTEELRYSLPKSGSIYFLKELSNSLKTM